MAESCPQCGSCKLYRDGMRYTSDGPIQRWLCRSCGYRFSSQNDIKVHVSSQVLKALDSRQNCHKNRVVSGSRSVQESSDSLSLLLSEDVCSHNLSSVAKGLNALPFYSSNGNYAPQKGAKKLSATQNLSVAGEKPQQQDKGRIIEFAWNLKKDGVGERTIKNYTSLLWQLMRKGADLNNPESIKNVIATQETWSNSSKALAVASYQKFAETYAIPWKPPKYRINRKLPFIPLETELDALISSSGKKTSTVLLLLKETGMRIGEALRLEWIALDSEHNLLTLNDTEKNGKPRMFKLSSKLVGMINSLPKEGKRLFGTTRLACLEQGYWKHRKMLARKLQNERLLQITFHTFRHWKATMEYHKTKDILHVMQLLGHRNIANTLIYTQLVEWETNDYHSATAKTTEEAKQLLESGFEYVCTTPESIMLFRKRK
jgi:integrase